MTPTLTLSERFQQWYFNLIYRWLGGPEDADMEDNAPPLDAQWTRDTPTTAGFYWMKPKRRAVRIVRVTARTIASGHCGIDCQWAGPLVAPK